MDIDLFKKDIEKCVEHLKEDLSQIRTGRANPELVEDVTVDAYGAVTPIKNVATISVVDAKTINIQPWDKSIVDNLAHGLEDANLGFSIIAEGDRVLVKLPDLTEERRKEYVKIMKERIEDGRVAVRQVRQKYMKEIDEAQKDGFSEDQADRLRDEIEKIVKETNDRIEEIRKEKEKELTTI
ncbi:MAG TPA: ribosome recycling factor [Candidatus Dojkabacteria bacterium]|jgi:ribosome recycling factor|nr:ribosome recycling factor [Candidatus Dojkabacteria bacterium]